MFAGMYTISLREKFITGHTGRAQEEHTIFGELIGDRPKSLRLMNDLCMDQNDSAKSKIHHSTTTCSEVRYCVVAWNAVAYLKSSHTLSTS